MDSKFINKNFGDKFLISGRLNDDNFNNTRKEKPLSEFSMFSVGDSFVSDDGTFNNKDDVVSVEDLNNVSRNDLLFTSVDSYDNILSDNDLLNCVSDGVNFYNETMTLYGNDGSKDLQQNGSVTLSDSNVDLLPLNSNNQLPNRCDVFTDVSVSEIASMTENLENIVPNLNAIGDTSCNDVSTDIYLNEALPDHKISSNISSLSNVELENGISPKTSSIFTGKEDKHHLGEFLNFKSSKTGLIDNTKDNLMLNNNIKYISCNSSPPKEDFGTVSLKNAKLISPRVIALMPNQSSCVVPVKKFKNVNGIATIRLAIKHSNADELKQSSLRVLNKDLTKNFMNGDKPKENIEKINIQKITDRLVRKVNKAVQTCNKTDGFSTALVEDGRRNTLNAESEDNTVDEPTDKLKRPDLRNNRFVFNFSANARNTSRGDLNFEEFHKDNEKIQYYTGIPKYSYFMALLNCLNLPANNFITPFQMLLLTLMKIRLNLDWMDLAFRFDKNINIVKETFGITLYILNKCLSRLVHWPMQHCSAENDRSRTGMNLYLYGIRLNLQGRKGSKINNRIFICLSTLNNPIHYVSTPIPENEYNSRIGMLVSSGIKDKLVVRDEIIFDEEIDCISVNGGRSAISVISRNGESFCDKPLNNSLFEIQKMKNTVSEIKKYKFLYDCITCGWVDELADEFTLYNDVVNVVCSLVNLCHVLPFCNVSVRNIISDRNSMEILLT